MRKYPLFFIFLSITFLSCRSQEVNEISSDTSSQEAVQMALLMREMHADLEGLKNAILDNEAFQDFSTNHKNLKSAKATDPKVQTDVFYGMVEAYLSSLAELEGEEGLELKGKYNSVVNNCISCHKQFCPGPIKLIQKLQID